MAQWLNHSSRHNKNNNNEQIRDIFCRLEVELQQLLYEMKYSAINYFNNRITV